MSRREVQWKFVQHSVPHLAHYVESRFAAHEHHVLATIRSDGSPRVSGTNVMFTDGTLWIGMMPSAQRLHDLRRNPSCALHSAPLNEKLPEGEGDVRLNAIARELLGDERDHIFRSHFPDTNDVMPGNFFELLVTEFSVVEVHEEEIVLTHWTEEGGVTISRHH